MYPLLKINLRVQRVAGQGDMPLPAYATEHSSGMDLAAAVQDSVTLEAGQRALIPTGFKIEIPPGFEGQIRPRSGLAVRSGISMVNTPGTIDADYRGEIKVIMINHGQEPFVINRGDRIAQLVIAPVAIATIVETETLENSSRNEGGFGHTGT